MKFRYASDLHLEFAFDKNFGFLKYTSNQHETVTKFRDYADHLIPPLAEDCETVLILAGDICEGWRAHTRYFGFFDRLASRFFMVLWNAGNHEYYGHKLSLHHIQRIEGTVSKQWNNVAFMNNRHVLVRGQGEPESEWVSVLGTTLWTNMDRGNPIATFQASCVMGDYKHITHADVDRDFYRVLRVQDTMWHHEREWNWLRAEIEDIRARKPTRKILVMTHHAPSYQSIPQRYLDRNDNLNHAYATNLPLECMTSLPNVWIHGHLHDSVDYHLDTLHVRSNPFGYIGEHINKQYDPFAIIDMENYHVDS